MITSTSIIYYQNMGKQQNNQPSEGASKEQVEKKKIIKKFPMKKFKTQQGQDDDGVKNWKPTPIVRSGGAKQGQSNTKNLSSLFLNSLPTPKNKEEAINGRKVIEDDEPIAPIRKNLVKEKPTQQQIKWDIQDKQFLQKQLKKMQEPTEKLVEGEDEEPEEIIVVKGRSQVAKVKHIDLNQVINKSWHETDNPYREGDLWKNAEGLLDGKGELARMAKQAIANSRQIDESLNKRSYEKKQMRNRYGW